MKNLYLTFIFSLSFLFTQSQNQEEVLRFSMDTRWTGEVDEETPWDQYPRPQMQRDQWTNLNGLWEYAIRPKSEDFPKNYDGKILVPFAVESSLSQVKKMVGEENYLWYRTSFEAKEVAENEELHLNFGAVDWEAVVYINGEVAGGHKGGYTPFSVNVTPYLQEGIQELIVRVWDPTDKGTQARGKQVQKPEGIWYTPVTGIWQTVWLERVPAEHIKSIKTTPDIDRKVLTLSTSLSDLSQPMVLKAEVLKDGKLISTSTAQVSPASRTVGMELDIPELELWSPENPFLYDLQISFLNGSGETIDQVDSYFGMRKISLGKDANGYTRILFNNEPVFQFGLLDQGWWPDGLYTAPTEEAMIFDVEMTMKLGFNMLRKHVKVEPARFYYHCDRLGMLVWQDMPNGNYFRDLRIEAWELEDAERSHDSALQFEKELKEMMDYFHSFPSIVVWVPFNEGWGQYDTERVTQWVSAYDPSRIVDSPSGWTDRGVGDIVDTHIYPGPGMEDPEEKRASVIGEFGGLGLTIKDHMWWDKKNWGYLTYNEKDAFLERFEELIADLIGLKSFGLSAAIYTQTTDVEGEVNGLITYDREIVKVDPEKTTKLFEPLYKPANNKRVLVPDAEKEPAKWNVYTGKNPSDWHKATLDQDVWQSMTAPFSSYDNFFLPTGTRTGVEDLYLRREFHLKEVPKEINLKYYLDKASARIFINGKEVTSEKFQGGRKRHYRNKLIKNADRFLKKGSNVISVEVSDRKEESSFDLGIYTSSIIK